MEIPDDVMTTEVRSFIAALADRGYVIVDEGYDEQAFGNALVALERDGTSVRVVRDRGQWFVEVAAAGTDEWFSPVVWHTMLDGAMQPLDVLPLGDQIRMLLDDLDQIEAANRAPGEEQVAVLRAWRARRAQARRSLPPTGR